MIKAKKGLLLSVFSLILALVITTSSTYAWFAMNSTVTASNMKITARADSSYLVIERTPSGTNPHAGKIGNINDYTLDLSEDANGDPVSTLAVLPITYRDLDGDGPNTTMGWQTNVGTGYDNGTASGQYQTVSEGSLAGSAGNGYAAKYTFYVGLNPYVSVQDASNLKVSSITLADSGSSNLFPALSVLVRSTVGGVMQAEDLYMGTSTTGRTNITGSQTVLASTINADGTPIQIDVFVFINGDNSVVTTEHTQAADLTTFTVGVSFTCTPPTQNA